MQERLDKWMKNTLPVPSAEKIRGNEYVNTRQNVYVARKGEGDMDEEEYKGRMNGANNKRR